MARASRHSRIKGYRPQIEHLELRTLLSAPPVSDFMEGNAASWSVFASDAAAASVVNDSARVQVGSQSFRFTTASGFDTGIRYTLPSGDLWDLSAAQSLSFWTYGENNTPFGFQGNQPIIVLTGPGGSFRYQPQNQQMVNHAWRMHNVPLAGDATWMRTTTGSPSLANITGLEVHQDTWDFGFSVYYDGLQFNYSPLS
jgi:hypothetical protein